MTGQRRVYMFLDLEWRAGKRCVIVLCLRTRLLDASTSAGRHDRPRIGFQSDFPAPVSPEILATGPTEVCSGFSWPLLSPCLNLLGVVSGC